jgi:hypothetical protein
MKKKIMRLATLILTLIIAVSSFATSVSALEWDGSSTGGGGKGSSAGPNGYAIRATDNETVCIGYRFSVVDKSGNNKTSKVIDVFRNTSYGNSEYSNAYKFSSKLNKKQLINGQNNS